MKKCNLPFKDLRPCPFCGAEVDAVMHTMIAKVNECQWGYPWGAEDLPADSYVVISRFVICCPQCYVKRDVASEAIAANEAATYKIISAAAKDARSHWNGGKKR